MSDHRKNIKIKLLWQILYVYTNSNYLFYIDFHTDPRHNFHSNQQLKIVYIIMSYYCKKRKKSLNPRSNDTVRTFGRSNTVRLYVVNSRITAPTITDKYGSFTVVKVPFCD